MQILRTRGGIKDVSFSVADGGKVAVVGLNGAGKSTLLSILAGALPADSGSVRLTGGGRVGFMPQTLEELGLPDDAEAYEFLLSGRPTVRIEKELTEVYSGLAGDKNPPAELVRRLDSLQDEFDRWGGYKAAAELDKMIASLKIPDDVLLSRL